MLFYITSEQNTLNCLQFVSGTVGGVSCDIFKTFPILPITISKNSNHLSTRLFLNSTQIDVLLIYEDFPQHLNFIHFSTNNTTEGKDWVWRNVTNDFTSVLGTNEKQDSKLVEACVASDEIICFVRTTNGSVAGVTDIEYYSEASGEIEIQSSYHLLGRLSRHSC